MPHVTVIYTPPAPVEYPLPVSFCRSGRHPATQGVSPAPHVLAPRVSLLKGRRSILSFAEHFPVPTVSSPGEAGLGGQRRRERS